MRKTGRGITIVSLVVTIIILLILATVSIQSLTHTGMFASANKAKLDTKRSQISEWLGLEVISEQTNNPTGSAEQIINQTHKNVLDKQEELKRFGKDIKVEDVSTEEDGEQVDVYFYVVVDKDIYKVDLKNHKFIGELGKMLPVIKIVSISNTTNSIKVKVKTSRNEGGIVEYYIKSEDDTRYTLKATKNDDSEYVYDNLIQGKKYSVKVVAKAENGQSAEAIAEQTTGTIINLKEGDLEFTSKPSTWTNTDVEVTVKANIDIKGYQLLTSQNPDKGWNKATSQIFKTNGIIYAVLSDGVNYGVAASRTIQNIDKTKPVVTGATATTNKIAITATDEASGIIGYAVTTSNTTPSSFTDVASTKTLSVAPTGYKQGTTYYVWVKDEAGNVSESETVTTLNVTGTINFGAITWAGGKASTTIGTNTSYTIQYQVNSTTGTWKTGTSVNGLVHGDKVYARLWDGTNGGTSFAINNILDGIKKLRDNGATIIYTTHYMEEVEILCDRIIILDKGKIIAQGTSDELKKMANIEEKITVEVNNIKSDLINDIKKFNTVDDVFISENVLHIVYKKGKNNLGELIDYFKEHKISYNSIFSERPTLNDVFLELTGKGLRD